MKNRRLILFTGVILFFFIISISWCCSTFCISEDNTVVFGKNYDWDVDEGLVIINKRDVPKVAFVFPPHKPAGWTSKYGSVTFNQYGREFPMDGMNEAGLVVSLMALGKTEYPPPDERPAVNCLGWIQYLLDNFATVDEALVGCRKINIDASTPVPCHYLICDKSGQAAVVEYIDGKLVTNTTGTLPIKALTNSPYKDSMAYFQKQQDSDFQGFNEQSAGSLNRFTKIARRLKSFDAETDDGADYSFSILDSVQWNRTQWKIVFDSKNGKILFKTRRFPDQKSIVLEKLDFSKETPVMILDMNSTEMGDVTSKFQDYSIEKNRALVKATFQKTPALRSFPDIVINAIAAYPENMYITANPMFRKAVMEMMKGGK